MTRPAELRIVVAGARMDLGQFDQAVVTLQTPDLDAVPDRTRRRSPVLRVRRRLVAAGRVEDGLKWFLNSAAADLEGDTDAEERVAELTGETVTQGPRPRDGRSCGDASTMSCCSTSTARSTRARRRSPAPARRWDRGSRLFYVTNNASRSPGEVAATTCANWVSRPTRRRW